MCCVVQQGRTISQTMLIGFSFLHAAFSVVTSPSTHALSPANDCADPRVRQNSKQREEELELIEQLRKVSAYRNQCVDVLVNVLHAIMLRLPLCFGLISMNHLWRGVDQNEMAPCHLSVSFRWMQWWSLCCGGVKLA